ncbi:MAG: adenylate/guanylate cyclase domain-containing protein [Pontiellaceae bacterium]|jgi:adenylate cyclase|nr:adenylate/guanylate cyclase domain-containing protein [Pontiellaceae bacterium]
MIKNRIKQVGHAALLGALLVSVAGTALLKEYLPLSATLLHKSYNLLFLLRSAIRTDEAVLVYLDDDSHRELLQPYDRPWDRGLHAQLLERLTADGARAVVFDIIFSGPNLDHPEGDERFAQAIRENGKVVLGADYAFTADGFPTLYAPYYLFAEAAQALGFVQPGPDDDFMVRRHLHVPREMEADSYSSFTWQVAHLIGVPVCQNPDMRSKPRWMNYYGPQGTIPFESFSKAINTNAIPAGAFSNKVVFVGGSLKTEFSGKHKDEYYTPYSKNNLEPAVNVQATQLLNLLRGDWLIRPSHSIEMLTILLAGILLGFGLVLLRPLPAAGFAAAAATLVTLAVYYLFKHHLIWFPWLIIIAVQIPVALLWSIIYNSIHLHVQSKLYQATLSLYLSPKLVKRFSSNRELLKPGAKKQTLTILFSDIADFTGISEGMDSDDLARQMNCYFETAVTKCIHYTDGTIVKYIGDAIFAFWNAPDPQSDHALRACEAALRFHAQPPQFMNGRQLVTRIGLHTGVANVGNFGSAARVDYTALGENINLASRMEGLNKHLGTNVLLTAETYSAIEGRYTARFLGLFRLKGFEKSVGVYELAGRPDRAEELRSLHEAFAAALNLFHRKDFDGAEDSFRNILKTVPSDGPSRFYLNHLAELRGKPLPEDWAGEVELKEK